MIFYDASNDDTLNKSINHQKKNNKLKVYINEKAKSQFRTHNIAYARNYCLNYIKKHKDDYPYFIMMDFDEVNCKNIKTDIKKNIRSLSYFYFN